MANDQLVAAMGRLKLQVATKIAKKKNLRVPERVLSSADLAAPAAEITTYVLANSKPMRRLWHREATSAPEAGSGNRERQHYPHPKPRPKSAHTESSAARGRQKSQESPDSNDAPGNIGVVSRPQFACSRILYLASLSTYLGICSGLWLPVSPNIIVPMSNILIGIAGIGLVVTVASMARLGETGYSFAWGLVLLPLGVAPVLVLFGFPVSWAIGSTSASIIPAVVIGFLPPDRIGRQ